MFSFLDVVANIMLMSCGGMLEIDVGMMNNSLSEFECICCHLDIFLWQY